MIPAWCFVANPNAGMAKFDVFVAKPNHFSTQVNTFAAPYFAGLAMLLAVALPVDVVVVLMFNLVCPVNNNS